MIKEKGEEKKLELMKIVNLLNEPKINYWLR